MSSEPAKHLILSVDHTDYGRYVTAHGLDPARCFQCVTPAEVKATAWRNAQWGIECRVHRTPEYQRRQAA